MKQAKWDVTCDLDWESFPSGEKLTFVAAVHDSSEQSDGFRFVVRGLIDSLGRFHCLSQEVTPREGEKP